MKKNYITPMTKTKMVDTVSILANSTPGNSVVGSGSAGDNFTDGGTDYTGEHEADSKRQTIWDEEE